MGHNEADLVRGGAIQLGFKSSQLHDSLAALPQSGFINFLSLRLLDEDELTECLPVLSSRSDT